MVVVASAAGRLPERSAPREFCLQEGLGGDSEGAVDQRLGRDPAARALYPSVCSASSAAECALHPCPPRCFCGSGVGGYGVGGFLIEVVTELLKRENRLGFRVNLVVPFVGSVVCCLSQRASCAGWWGWLVAGRLLLLELIRVRVEELLKEVPQGPVRVGECGGSQSGALWLLEMA